MDIIEKKLFQLQDNDYRLFTGRSIPNIDINKIIGVRLPQIRALAKEIKNEDYIEDFLNELPHKYQEENLLHGILLNKYKDIDELLLKIDIFLDYVDNWAVSDTICPKLFKKHMDKAFEYITKWIKSNTEYKIRFGVVSLLQFYLTDEYILKAIKLVRSIKYDSYYVNMAIAWFYSFALVKQYDNVINVFEEKKLSKWIHNKSIQKALESYRISDNRKEYLKSLKIK